VSCVLEYMDAGTLQDLISAGVRCTERILSSVAHSVLQGLHYLHSKKLLHRDIKASNVLIAKCGHVKISDFGLSRDLANTQAMADTFTGTLLYMSPERISGGSYSYPSDIWSFGLVILACAIGRLPFPVEDGYWGVVHAVQSAPSPKLSDYGDFSPELGDFIDQCLHKDPAKRWTAEQLLQHPLIKKNYVPRSFASPIEPLDDDLRMYLESLVADIADWHYQRIQPSRRSSEAPLKLPALGTSRLKAFADQLGAPFDEICKMFARYQHPMSLRQTQ